MTSKLQTKILEKALEYSFELDGGMDVRVWASGLSSSVCKILLKDDRIWKVLKVSSPEDTNRFFTKAGFKRAKGKFKSLITGKKATKRTNWVKFTDEEIREKVIKIILSQDISNRQKELEISAFRKWGPQGGNAKLEDLIVDILDYFDPIDYKISETVEDAIVAKVVNRIKKALRANGFKDEDMLVTGISSSAAYAEITSKGSQDATSAAPVVLPRKSRKSIRVAFELCAQHIINLPNMLGSTVRKLKNRIYWRPSFAQNLYEKMIAVPLVRLMRSTGLACFQAMENLDFIGASLTNFWLDNELVLDGDYKKMDTKCGLDASRVVYKILSSFTEEGYWRGHLQRCLENAVSVDLLITETLRLQGNHGLGSGSIFTNFFEVIYNLYEMEYLKAHTYLPQYGNKHDLIPLETDPKLKFTVVYYINGDDLKLIVTAARDGENLSINTKYYFNDGILQGFYTLQQIFCHVATLSGLVVQFEKVTLEKDHSAFCQFHYFKDQKKTIEYINADGELATKSIYKSVYLIAPIVNTIVNRQWAYDEEKWTLEDETVRTITVLEKAKDNPLFQPLLTFIQSMIPGRLGVDIWIKDEDGTQVPFFTKRYLKTLTAKARDLTYNNSWNIASATLGFENFYTVRFLMSSINGNFKLLENLKEDMRMYNSQLVYMIERTLFIESDLQSEDYSTIAKNAPKGKISEKEFRERMEIELARLRADGLLTE